MKIFLLAATAAAAFTAATPASAQLGGIIQREIMQQGLRNILGGGSSNSVRLERLDDRIQQASRRGDISPQEARRLYDEYEQLRRLERDYRNGGINREERYDLDRRVDQLERRIEDARLNRDGRYDDDYDDRDGAYDRGSSSRRNGCPPGLAKKNNGCLPPGQARKNDRGYDGRDRFPGEYQDRLQDNDRFIFRRQSDGRIFQIDRRTGEVVRVINPRR